MKETDRKLTPEMALEMIEEISAHAGLDRSRHIGTDKEEHDAEMDNIYAIAHVATRTCENLHTEWEIAALRQYDAMKLNQKGNRD